VGDCGWASPSPYLALRGRSLERLVRSEAAYEASLTSRLNLRFAERTTLLAEPSGMMSTFYAVDGRRVTAPFLPCTMGSDTVFAAIVSACFPDALFALDPLALLHRPVEPRRFWRGEVLRTASGIDFSTVLLALIGSRRREPAAAPADALRRLGRFLAEIGSLEPETFDRTVHEAVTDREAAALAEREALVAARGGPPFWVRDQEAYLRLRREAIARPDFAVPLDLSVGRDAAAARALSRRFVRRYGELIEWWPDLVAAATRLREAGAVPARPLHELARAGG
jgi:hypothetical protein